MSVNANDFEVGFDPTGYVNITGAQLAQLVNSANPQVDKGMSILTTDNGGGNPEVPDAATTTKWQRYLWIRQSATSTGLYVWNDNAASNATFLKWQSVIVAGIGVETIVNSMIANNTIQDVKIANLSYSKLTGAPTGLPPSGAASGDLAGTYPSPVVGPNAITHSKIGAQAVQVPTDILPGVASSILRTNSGATACEWATQAQAGARILQIVTAQVTNRVNGGANLASITAAPAANATGLNDTGFAVAFTPISAASTLFIECSVPIGTAGTGAACVALYAVAIGSGATPPIAVAGFDANASTSHLETVVIEHSVASGSTTLRTYYVGFGAGGAISVYLNSRDGANVFFGASKAVVTITEYL